MERATFYIAPGNPATVGQEGSVTGVVPGRAVRAPRGAMGSLGGVFGTPWVHGDPDGTTPPAVTASKASMKTSAAPVRGANSFTLGEARRRLTRNGFAEVTGLQRDRDGIWRGKAVRDGVPVNVFCDYQGNVGAS